MTSTKCFLTEIWFCRFTHILGIFTWNKQSHSVLPETLSAEEKTQNIWFAFTVGDSCSGLQKNLTFHTTASCSLGLHSHPADHIRGRCQGGEPLLTLLPAPHALGHEQLAQPQMPTRAACTRNRLRNYSQIKLIQAHLTHMWGWA